MKETERKSLCSTLKTMSERFLNMTKFGHDKRQQMSKWKKLKSYCKLTKNSFPNLKRPFSTSELIEKRIKLNYVDELNEILFEIGSPNFSLSFYKT